MKTPDIPVIFLAFADDKDNHLPLLQQEAEDIFRELNPLQNRQHIQVFRDQHADIRKIYHYLTDYKGRVAIFHYAGHADSSSLRLEGQDADAKGIAELLAQEKRLKLVFLNGCSTRKQVDYLLGLGIPAVIATQVEVKDEMARDFAGQFYKALAKPNTTIEEAFHSAASLAQSVKKFSPRAYYRGAGFAEEEEKGFPWGLYLGAEEGSEAARAVLEYKLPLENHREIIIWGTPAYPESAPKLNEGLVMQLFEEFSKTNEEIRKWTEFFSQFGSMEYKAVRAALINILPAPIGQQFRKLVFGEQEAVSRKISAERIRQIVNTYDVLVRFLFFIMLSQLWDAIYYKKLKAIPSAFFDEFDMYLSLRPSEARFYNFVKLIRLAYRIFSDEQNQLEPFIKEMARLKEAFDEEQEFYEAHLFLEDIKHQMPLHAKEEELKSLCIQGEKHLATIFTKLGFCINYKLLTIKSVELHRERYKKEEYQLKLVNLFRIMQGVEDTQRSSPYPIDSQSVLLLRDEKDLSVVLSLSPFIIDENALKGAAESKLYFFHHFEQDEAGNFAFVYQFSEQLDEHSTGEEPSGEDNRLIVNDDHFPNIKGQFESFLRIMRNARASNEISYVG